MAQEAERVVQALRKGYAVDLNGDRFRISSHADKPFELCSPPTINDIAETLNEVQETSEAIDELSTKLFQLRKGESR